MGGFCQRLITAAWAESEKTQRERTTRRSTVMHACIHFQLKLPCVIHKLRNANGEKGNFRLQHVNFHQHKQSIAP